MIYHVKAKFKTDTAKRLISRLNDGSIAKQRPDGAELVASMNRAVVNADGWVEWSEMCFCPTPLMHERATVLDQHFDQLKTRPIEAHSVYEGRSFMAYLQDLTKAAE